jgi:hypothetical protein
MDDLHDQEILEQLLEASKPALPPVAKGLHYLLSTAPASGAIRYESARREGGHCVVVFEPTALSFPGPYLQQTWIWLSTTRPVPEL